MSEKINGFFFGDSWIVVLINCNISFVNLNYVLS